MAPSAGLLRVNPHEVPFLFFSVPILFFEIRCRPTEHPANHPGAGPEEPIDERRVNHPQACWLDDRSKHQTRACCSAYPGPSPSNFFSYLPDLVFNDSSFQVQHRLDYLTVKYPGDCKRTSDNNCNLFSFVDCVCVCVICLLTCVMPHIAYMCG